MSDIQKLIELEIGFRDSISKRLDTVKASVETLSEKLKDAANIDSAKPIEIMDRKMVNSIKSAYRMEKALDATHRMLKDFGIEGLPDALKDLQQLNKMSDSDIKAFQNLAEKKIKHQEETILKKEQEQEIEEGIHKELNRRLSEVREEQDIVNTQFGTFKDLAGASASKLADMVGFGNEFSTAIGKAKSVFGIMNKLFLEPAKKRMERDKLYHYTVMKNGKLEHKFATYRNKTELKAIESVVKSRTKASKLGLKQAAQAAGAGGGGGAGAAAGAAAAGGGGGAGAAGIAGMLPALMTPVGAAVAAVAVAIGAVVAAALVMKKALTEASAVMEEFHTVNYNAVGGASALTEAVADLAGRHGFLVDEVKKSTKALAEQGFIVLDANGKMSAMFEKLSVKVAAYARTTGLAEEEVAKFLKTQRGIGVKTLADSEKPLLKLASAMQRYGFTTAEAGEILKATQGLMWKFNVTLGLGAKSADVLTSMMIKGGKAAKALGMDISVVTNLINEMSNDFTKFIVATGGKSLEGPEAALSALIDNINNVEEELKGKTAFERDIILKNVYDLDEQQLKWAARMKEDTIEWKKELEKTAIANGASQEEILKIQKMGAREYLKSVDSSEKLIANIEQAAKESNNNTDRMMNLLSDKVKAILIKLGVKLMPIFIKIGKVILDVFEKVYEFLFGDADSDIFSDARESIKDASLDVAKSMEDYAKESLEAAQLKELSNKYDKEEQALKKAREAGTINQVKYEESLKSLADRREALRKISAEMEEKAQAKAVKEWTDSANDTQKASNAIIAGMNKRKEDEKKGINKSKDWFDKSMDFLVDNSPVMSQVKALKQTFSGEKSFMEAQVDRFNNMLGVEKWVGRKLYNWATDANTKSKPPIVTNRENSDIAAEKVTEKQKEKSTLDERSINALEMLVEQLYQAEQQSRDQHKEQIGVLKTNASDVNGLAINTQSIGGMRSPR